MKDTFEYLLEILKNEVLFFDFLNIFDFYDLIKEIQNLLGFRGLYVW